MQIVPIFAQHYQLFSFRYENQTGHVFDTSFEQWSDPEYVEEFFSLHENDLKSGYYGAITIEEAALKTFRDSRRLAKELRKLSYAGALDQIFKPLGGDKRATNFEKSKAYGVGKKSWLRIYAIKIQDNVYAVTGGAIKLSEKMNRPHLQAQLKLLLQCSEFLKAQQIIDYDGFMELALE